MLIDGRATRGARPTRTITSPATGEVIGEVALGAAEDVDLAVAAARRAARPLARMSPFERADLCERIADAIDGNAGELAELLSAEHGKPAEAEARGEVAGAASAFRDAAGQVRWARGETIPTRDAGKRAFVERRPHGVCAAITPWNFPLGVATLYYLAPGLAASNAMVWVPAPSASLVASRLAACIHEAGLPDGALNLVTGEGPVVGHAAAAHPGVDAVGFTGSTGVGRQVAAAATGKPLLLELGGNGPTIVFPDADLALAAAEIAGSTYTNAGQICTSTGRILAHAEIAAELAERLAAQAAARVVGLPADPDTTMGPVHLRALADRVLGQVAAAAASGARILTGGERVADMPTAHFVAPTVVDDVPAGASLHVDETFGPVAPGVRWRDAAELERLVDASPSGLFAAVFSADVPAALRFADELPCGTVNINSASSYWEPQLPAGGATGRESGIGRAGGSWSIHELTQTRTVTIALARSEESV
jgi:succinate-semialdehyde dehydrogenase/glutarate-semialdehyde dehydrogenase